MCFLWRIYREKRAELVFCKSGLKISVYSARTEVMFLVLELGLEIDEMILARGRHAEVVFSEKFWGY